MHPDLVGPSGFQATGQQCPSGTAFDDLRWARDMHRATTSDRIDAFAGVDAGADAAVDG